MHGDSRDSVAERRMLLPFVKEVSRGSRSYVVSFDGFLKRKKLLPPMRHPFVEAIYLSPIISRRSARI